MLVIAFRHRAERPSDRIGGIQGSLPAAPRVLSAPDPGASDACLMQGQADQTEKQQVGDGCRTASQLTRHYSAFHSSYWDACKV
jgi:hypothetical protein